MLIQDRPVIVAEAGGSRKGNSAAGRRVGALERRSVYALSGLRPERGLDASAPVSPFPLFRLFSFFSAMCSSVRVVRVFRGGRRPWVVTRAPWPVRAWSCVARSASCVWSSCLCSSLVSRPSSLVASCRASCFLRCPLSLSPTRRPSEGGTPSARAGKMPATGLPLRQALTGTPIWDEPAWILRTPESSHRLADLARFSSFRLPTWNLPPQTSLPPSVSPLRPGAGCAIS